MKWQTAKQWQSQKIHGFYAVLDQPSTHLCLQLIAATPVVQVRKKPATYMERLEIATIARTVTARANRLLVINDDIDLAHQVGADGVHLGQDDEPLTTARRRTDLMIGISTHNLKQLEQAVAEGADYIAYGPVFSTATKANAEPVVGIDGLTKAVQRVGDIPLVAIGGITKDTAAAVAATGVSAACVISAVNKATDPRAAARSIASFWRQ